MNSDVALWLGGAGTTVLGAGMAWIGQSRLASRQRSWASEDLARTQEHHRELRDGDIREARFQRLRSERREVYARALDAVEGFVAAVRDLRDAGPRKGVEFSLADIEQVHPIPARALRCMATQRRLDSDIVLIADHGVRDNFLICRSLDGTDGRRSMRSWRLFCARCGSNSWDRAARRRRALDLN